MLKDYFEHKKIKVEDRCEDYYDFLYDYHKEDHIRLERDKDHITNLYHQEGVYIPVAWEWVVPLSKLLKEKYGEEVQVLEVMSGRGLLAQALKEKGINIITTDNLNFKEIRNKNMFVDLDDILDAEEAVRKYNHVDIVIMSYPPNDCDVSERVLRAVRDNNLYVLFIGDEEPGYTASREFYKQMKIIEDEGINKINDLYKGFQPYNDIIYLIE